MRRFFYILLLLLLPASAMAVTITVSIEGLERKLETNVRAFLSIEQEKAHSGLTASRLRLLHKQAPDEIRQALQPFGYFKPVIDGRLEQEEDRFVATYKVESGPRVEVASVDYQVTGEGAGEPTLTQAFPLAEGDGLDLVLYEKAKQQRLSQALELGYLNAHYTAHEVRVDQQRYDAVIQLHLETGMRFQFGEIRLQQDILDPKFLARYLSFGTGDPYSHEKLLELQSKLIDTDYFKLVEVNARRDQIEGNRIPVDIELVPNKRNRYRVGLGYSTDTGPRMTLDWRRRRFGREGHHMRSELRVSQPESSLTSEYIIPLRRPSEDYLSFGATLDYYDLDTNQGNRALLNVSESIALAHGWRRTRGLDYLYEDYTAGSQDDSAHLLVPSLTWAQIQGNSRQYLTRGHRIQFHLEGASDALLSTTSYFQLYTTDKFIYGLNDDWRLLARADLGATWAEDLLQLPPSKRFYTGGDNTIRGFNFQELGPRDENGEVIGGRYLAVGSLELERRFSGRWSGAVFFDKGNAYDPDYHAEAAYGTGLGIRWRSPVGPIRFDLAQGRIRDQREWRLHVVLGPEL